MSDAPLLYRTPFTRAGEGVRREACYLACIMGDFAMIRFSAVVISLLAISAISVPDARAGEVLSGSGNTTQAQSKAREKAWCATQPGLRWVETPDGGQCVGKPLPVPSR